MKSGPKARARRLGGVMVMLLAAGPAVIAVAPSAEAYVPSLATRAAYQARVIQQINAVRASNRRGGLSFSNCPARFATNWSTYLARTGAFYHQSMYPILRVCRASKVAENLARGNVSADRIVAAWMASPGHRANVLDGALTRVAVSAVYARGQWNVTADFARY